MPKEDEDYRLGECCGACNMAANPPLIPKEFSDIKLRVDQSFCLEHEEPVSDFMVCDSFDANESLADE